MGRSVRRVRPNRQLSPAVKRPIQLNTFRNAFPDRTCTCTCFLPVCACFRPIQTHTLKLTARLLTRRPWRSGVIVSAKRAASTCGRMPGHALLQGDAGSMFGLCLRYWHVVTLLTASKLRWRSPLLWRRTTTVPADTLPRVTSACRMDSKSGQVHFAKSSVTVRIADVTWKTMRSAPDMVFNFAAAALARSSVSSLVD